MLPRKKAQAAFAIATFFIFVSGLAAVFCVIKLRSTQEWVNHSYDVENAIANVNTIVSRSGRLRAEYVNSGDSRSLQEYKGVLLQIPRALDDLRALTRDNAFLQENCTQLEAITNKRVLLMQEAVRLNRRTNPRWKSNTKLLAR